MLAFSFDEREDCTQSVQIQMRSKAVVRGIPITTTIAALTSTVEGLEDRLAFNSGCYKTPTATQPRLPCLRSQGTSTTSEDSKFVVYRNTTGT